MPGLTQAASTSDPGAVLAFSEGVRETDFKSLQDMALARSCLTFLYRFAYPRITAPGLSSDEQNQA